MVRRTYRVFTALLCMAAFCASLCAQTGKTITLRMLDGKTGKLIETSNFLVRVDHGKTVHADWVVQNENGTGKLSLPASASLLLIQATYDSAMRIYIDCDSGTVKGDPIDHWYSVAEILSSGIVAPNVCAKPKEAARFKPAAKPGEFVFFVRTENWREEAREFSSR